MKKVKEVKAYSLSKEVIAAVEAMAKKKERSASWIVNKLLEEKLHA